MKKLLLSLALVAAGVGFAAADTSVEFVGNSKDGVNIEGTTSGNNIQPITSMTKNGLTIKFYKDNGDTKGSTAPAWYYINSTNTTNAAWRLYANNTMTFVVPSGQTIKSVVFHTVSSWDCTTKYGNLIVSAGAITPQASSKDDLSKGMDFTWTGEVTDSVRISVPAKSIDGASAQFQFDKVTVVLGNNGGGPVAPPAPAINGTTPFYGSSNTITMSAETGAEIYYTMSVGGTPADPTTSSLKYEDEIVINATTTFKAIAVKDGLSSNVATKTFTKGEAVEVSSIADFLSKESGTVCHFVNPVTVMGLYDKRYLFVEDATGALQIFSSNNQLDRPYQMGQTISGFTGKADIYQKNPQLAVADFAATFSATASGTAREINPKQIEATQAAVEANKNAYVVVTGTVTKTGNNYFVGPVQLYKRFNTVDALTDDIVDQSKDVAGFAVMYNTTPEIYFTKTGAPGTLNVNGLELTNERIYGANGYVVAPEGAQIYSINGVRVANANLAAGIYLVRYNGATTKVVVR